ncbi:FAD-dependent monooxygenase [Salinibacterium sp. ZJ454]|uniref:FAD-dependent monooxygenase n=1 Tax=Salinibacterium sp. ZJ454 TaxID=2708339 RepID=UPI00142379D3|nr:FAD-dependent monooxygenase [Salinibacterium sp. ZJ454]
MASGPFEPENDEVDVLIVGAGPSGLALAVELQRFGIRFRIIDREPQAVHESRALAIQPRSLEVLAASGVAAELVELGRSAVQVSLHLGERELPLTLYAGAVRDTAYPYLLFLSQAETERVLGRHLAEGGVPVERGYRLVALQQNAGGVRCTIETGGATSTVRARFVAGCDGAHSAVRHLTGLGFHGTAFPQTFGLADLEVDGLPADRVHAFLSAPGILLFFPIESPASWRMIVMLPTGSPDPPSLPTLQAAIARHTASPPRLHDPVWTATFSVNSRHAARFRAGRAFLVGDAAHIHSPAGAQGMNTGIQDAANLAWKLAFVLRGQAGRELLATYDTERRPVARQVIRLTNRAFRVATSSNPAVRFIRARIAPRIAALVLGGRSRRGGQPARGGRDERGLRAVAAALRTAAFRTVAELNINYRHSPLSVEGTPSLQHGPMAGRRLPDAAVLLDGRETTLHQALAAPFVHVLLCGASDDWEQVTGRLDRWTGVLRVHRLATSDAPGALIDSSGDAFRRLGLTPGQVAQLVVRPDGHIGYRAAGFDPSGLALYLRRSMRLSPR